MNIDRKELVDALVEAAEFYADSGVYCMPFVRDPKPGQDLRCAVLRDNGKIAREALAALNAGREAARVDVRKRFDEQALRDDIVAAFGPAGAHVDLLDMLTAELAEAKRGTAMAVEQREAAKAATKPSYETEILLDKIAELEGKLLAAKDEQCRAVATKLAEIVFPIAGTWESGALDVSALWKARDLARAILANATTSINRADEIAGGGNKTKETK